MFWTASLSPPPALTSASSARRISRSIPICRPTRSSPISPRRRGTLISGVVASSLLLVYVSVGMCAIAMLLLAGGVLQHRKEIFGTGGAVAPAGPQGAFPESQLAQLASSSVPLVRAAESAAGHPPTGQMAGSGLRSERPATGWDTTGRAVPPGGRPSARRASGGRPPARESAGGPPSGKPGGRDPGRPAGPPRHRSGDPFWPRVSDDPGPGAVRDTGAAARPDTGAAARPRAEDPQPPGPPSPDTARAEDQRYGSRP